MPESISKKVILVVEDDQSSQLLLQHAIGSKYALKFAVSVREAWACLEKERVDLIILDLSLEGKEDGLDLTCALRESDKWVNLPVIVTTAHAFVTDRDNCLEAGCTEYLSKPLRLSRLTKLLEHYLNLEPTT
ncbi:MAG: response regulator [Fidelibacterota bacterium]